MKTKTVKLRRNIWKGIYLKGIEEKTFYSLQTEKSKAIMYFETMELLKKAKKYISESRISKKYKTGFFNGLEFYREFN